MSFKKENLLSLLRSNLDNLPLNELKNNKPKEPVIFLKTDTSVILKNQPFFIPNFSSDIHHEVELLVKIIKV